MSIGEERLLTHSASDESLFDDLKHVVVAPRHLLSHLVGSRTKEDREELKRILTHLPAIREVRADRAANKTQRGYEPPNVLTVSGGGGGGTPRGGATPRSSGTPRSGNGAPPPAGSAPPSVPATPRGGTPREAGTPRGAQYTPRSQPGGTPRGSRGNTPRIAGASIVASTAQDERLSSADVKAALATKKAKELRGDKQKWSDEDEKKAAAQATQRVIEKLAELGIDPEGMSATDILRIFYARGSGSSYWLANREAEKRLAIRASTPKSFQDVLMPTADRQIRRARDLPVTNVHEYLDQWEIAFLGDICRSLRCFDEAAEGHSSEYMGKFTKRQYGAKSGRREYIRPPT